MNWREYLEFHRGGGVGNVPIVTWDKIKYVRELTNSQLSLLFRSLKMVNNLVIEKVNRSKRASILHSFKYCVSIVSCTMNCNYCNGPCIEKGFYRLTQKLFCKACQRYQRSMYRYKKQPVTDQQLKLLNNEGMSISSISRVVQVSKTTIERRILWLSAETGKPTINETGQVYELDELYTYVGSKCNPCYVIYPINKRTRLVIDFICGARTSKNVNRVVSSLLVLKPKRIYTDGLNLYQNLIPKGLHTTSPYRTNRIERKNLTLRTHLKRLSRKTICYSASVGMLETCFKLYVWA